MAEVIYTTNSVADAERAKKAKAAKSRHDFMNPPSSTSSKPKKGGNYVTAKVSKKKAMRKKPAKAKAKRNPYSPLTQPTEHAAWKVRNAKA